MLKFLGPFRLYVALAFIALVLISTALFSRAYYSSCSLSLFMSYLSSVGLILDIIGAVLLLLADPFRRKLLGYDECGSSDTEPVIRCKKWGVMLLISGFSLQLLDKLVNFAM